VERWFERAIVDILNCPDRILDPANKPDLAVDGNRHLGRDKVIC